MLLLPSSCSARGSGSTDPGPPTPGPPTNLQGNRQNYSALGISNPSIRCDFLGLTTLPGTPGPASCPAVIPPLVPPSPPPPDSPPPTAYDKVAHGIDHAASTVIGGVNKAASAVKDFFGSDDDDDAGGDHARKVLCEPGDDGCGKLARRLAARLPKDSITVLEAKDLLESD